MGGDAKLQVCDGQEAPSVLRKMREYLLAFALVFVFGRAKSWGRCDWYSCEFHGFLCFKYFECCLLATLVAAKKKKPKKGGGSSKVSPGFSRVHHSH